MNEHLRAFKIGLTFGLALTGCATWPQLKSTRDCPVMLDGERIVIEHKTAYQTEGDGRLGCYNGIVWIRNPR